ncbi:MAG: PDZ domain-containing protein [Rickettsiaceae bacterium]|nr:MAG: PDZ domain-containing protein [Rickettsiaceae bacterium]
MRNCYLITFLSILFVTNLTSADEQNDQVYLKQFQEAFERVKKDYVQAPDRQKMVDGAINGMLSALDPHSSYFVDEDLEDFISHTKGQFGGIGVEVIFENGAVKIISPIDDLPAYRAGMEAGDYIVGVNDELVSNLGYNKAVKEMRGAAGTKVKLLVIRETENKPKEIELTREIVTIKPVKTILEDGDIAYVRIATFNEHTMNELDKSIKKLQDETKNNAGIKGIILDLRNNPGGLLDQAVAVSEFFIDSGTIVTTKGRNSSNNSILQVTKTHPKAPKVPIVALINGGSASAAEIVAGALQDHKRAIIVGSKSFGKGSVQTFLPTRSRGDAAIKLTTAKYYTPSGRSIQADGINPDIIIEQAKVEYLDKKKEEKRFSEASLKNYLKNETLLDKEKNANEIKNQTNDNKQLKENNKKSHADSKKNKEELNNNEDKKKNDNEEPKFSELYMKDYQYARAYDLIRGLIIAKNQNSN